LKFFDDAPIYQMSRAPRSALGSDPHDIATKRQAVDVDAADAIFLCKKNTRLKNLFDDAWKFNARVSQRHCYPLQGIGSATIQARVRCLLLHSPAFGSTSS
jgi:hypothetical protein